VLRTGLLGTRGVQTRCTSDLEVLRTGLLRTRGVQTPSTSEVFGPEPLSTWGSHTLRCIVADLRDAVVETSAWLEPLTSWYTLWHTSVPWHHVFTAWLIIHVFIIIVVLQLLTFIRSFFLAVHEAICLAQVVDVQWVTCVCNRCHSRVMFE